jgi:hypothetical protein
MSNSSNLYAEKVFAEHPLGLWALDEKLDYLSLIQEAQRDVEDLWTVTGGTAFSGAGVVGEPFTDSPTTTIKGSVPTGNTNQIVCISPNLANFSTFDEQYGNFCIGSYIYIDSIYAQSISIGYEYTDPTSLLVYQELKTFEVSVFDSWIFVSETFDTPDETTNFRAVIKINTLDGGSTTDDYIFHINGVTAGQWSEEFNTSSLGVQTIQLPSSISLYGGMQGVESFNYGIQDTPGYYLSALGLLARNTSLPLVFGASNLTKLNVSSGASLIVPGKGFLNNKGKYNNYTVEFWARINSDSSLDKRIFGPISSTDGLYINGGFLTLSIGNNFASHFVGEWYRPMLIHIRFIGNTASLLINGEQVLSFNFNIDDLTFPDELDEEGKDQDWLGFYSYADINPFEIDCISIYPYQVPITVAKRRWVYGQAVISPESIDSSYGGVSTFIDYPFSGYTANYSYPNFAKWEQGSFDNLTTSPQSLSTPQYSLPNISIQEKTIENLYSDNKEIQDEANNFITFRPNNSWNNVHSYFNFNNFNIINSDPIAIYGIFSSTNMTSVETLFTIYNSITKNYFSVIKEGDHINYSLYYNGEEQIIYDDFIYQSFYDDNGTVIDAGFYNTASWEEVLEGGSPSTVFSGLVSGDKYIAGINIEKLVSYFGGNVATFFGNKNGLEIYIAGDTNPENSFTGNIYSFGISSKFNTNLIKDNFDQSGIILNASVDEMINHTASYTLVPFEKYNNYFLDINSYGYWEDYMPLSYFAKYVTNSKGKSYYDLDFLQFNIDIPAPSTVSVYEQVSSWNYSTLKNEYLFPIQKSYDQLDNFLLTNWEDYAELNSRSVENYRYDTSNSTIKTYISFQYIQDGANNLESFFTTIQPIENSLVIDIDSFENWETTKFEVINNTIIYPSKKVNFNDLAIVYHIELNATSINKNPISIKNLEIASQALNDNSFNPIGTRFGQNIFPFKQSGVYYDYKSKNPFNIYKGSTPYLYLTRDSGIKVSGETNLQTSRGISVPINSSLALDYKVNAIQLWMRYDSLFFSVEEETLFDIDYKGDTIKFYVLSDNVNGTRGKVVARSQSTNQEYQGISYYWNGNLVREPRITKNEWGVLSVSFPESLNFNSYLGSINLTGSALFNNVSYYQSTGIQKIQKSINRPWTRVKNDISNDLDWQYWLDSYTWNGVLVLSTVDLYGSNPVEIYKTYIGTNKIIVDDSQGMLLDSVNIKVYKDTSWQIQVKTPV